MGWLGGGAAAAVSQANMVEDIGKISFAYDIMRRAVSPFAKLLCPFFWNYVWRTDWRYITEVSRDGVWWKSLRSVDWVIKKVKDIVFILHSVELHELSCTNVQKTYNKVVGGN